MTDQTDNASELEAKLNKALESIAKLEAKNKELAAEKQQAKSDAQEALEAAEKAAEEKALASTSIDEVRASLEAKHKREMEKLTNQLNETIQGRDKLLIDNAISNDLAALNVAPQFRAILTQAFKSQAEVKNNEALINGVALSDHIKEFMSGDDGKHYVAAPVNSGAGAVGASKVNTDTITRENFNLTEFTQLAKEKPAEAKAINDRLGLNLL